MPSWEREIRLRRQPLGPYRYVRLRWRLLFAAVDFAGRLAFGAARTLRALVGRVLPGRQPAHENDTTDPRTILLVQLDHLGDAILSTVMLPALRSRYPNASIEVLAGPWNRELWEAMPEVDRVHVSRLNRFARGGRFGWTLATFWWGWRLRRRNVDLAIDVRGEFPLALILWLSGARRRLGWNCGGGGFLLTHSPRFVPDRPEVESRWALLAELGVYPPFKDQPENNFSESSSGGSLRLTPATRKSGTYSSADPEGEMPSPAFHPPEEARRTMARRLDALSRQDGLSRQGPDRGPRVVVHVGAGTAAKQWPVEHWRELIGRLVVYLGAQVILVGGPGDRKTARAILGRRAWPAVTDWTGRLRLVELAALAEQADVLVGADSGPAHLAAAVGTPVVVLFSGTNSPRQWQPSGRQVRVLRQAVACAPCHRRRCGRRGHPCMRGLTPKRVAQAVEAVCRQVGWRRVARAGPARMRDVRMRRDVVRVVQAAHGVSGESKRM